MNKPLDMRAFVPVETLCDQHFEVLRTIEGLTKAHKPSTLQDVRASLNAARMKAQSWDPTHWATPARMLLTGMCLSTLGGLMFDLIGMKLVDVTEADGYKLTDDGYICYVMDVPDLRRAG